jgi:putative salt-induced outer membrane protein YdiY
VVLRKLQQLTVSALLPLAVLFFTSSSFADQITLKNGDRITGKIVKGDGKSIVLHTDAAGDVTIQLSSVQDIKTDQDLHIGLKNGKTVVGPVTSTDGKLEVATKNAGTVEAPEADVTAIRNDAEETAWEKAQHPGLLHGWTGGANVGFSVARGNSETENLALAFNAVHNSANDKWTLYATSIDTTNNLATPSTVANLETGGLRYDHNLNARIFVFGSADFMANALQFLDLRSIYSGGFGAHVIKNAKTALDVFGGLNYTHETYSNGAPTSAPGVTPVTYASYGQTNRFVALTIGDQLTQQLGKSTVLTEAATFFPDLQQTGQYRAIVNIGTVTKLNKVLGWQNQFNDIYDSNPPTGTKENDVIFTTGLNFTFAR